VRILFLGDVFGAPGRRAVESRLRDLRDELEIDVCIVNGENAADGIGLTAKLAEKLLAAGADAITLGNHVWRQRDLVPFLDSSDRIVRPANLGGPGTPGKGVTVVPARDGTPVAVVNLQGQLFLEVAHHPFVVVDELVAEARKLSPIIVVDFHAEATSEKIALDPADEDRPARALPPGRGRRADRGRRRRVRRERPRYDVRGPARLRWMSGRIVRKSATRSRSRRKTSHVVRCRFATSQ